ncbi:MAG TPA: hypothetical protein VG871_04230 [Vicinamibacterales bacterium]|nr:hypothetical protein [Vicinamibacterales bacterium]
MSPQRTPTEVAFSVAQRKAATTAAVGLRESALDLTASDLLEGLDATRDALIAAYRAEQVGIADDKDAIHDEAGYLFGLAVGVALGRGGAR